MCLCEIYQCEEMEDKNSGTNVPLSAFLCDILTPSLCCPSNPGTWSQSGLKCVLLPRPQILWSLALYSGIGPFLWWEESSIRNEGKSTHRRKAAIKRREGEESCVWLPWIKESLSGNVCICCRTPAMKERERGRALSYSIGCLLNQTDRDQGHSCYLWLFLLLSPLLLSVEEWSDKNGRRLKGDFEPSVGQDMAEDISLECNSSFLFNATGSGVQETGGFCGIRATLLALSLYSWPLNLTYWR